MHPTEPTCPCCLPALGEFSEMSPHEGLRRVYGASPPNADSGLAPHRFVAHPSNQVTSPAEDSPSGLWRSLGKRVGCKPSGVRIPYPPPLQSFDSL